MSFVSEDGERGSLKTIMIYVSTFNLKVHNAFVLLDIVLWFGIISVILHKNPTLNSRKIKKPPPYHNT